MYDFFTFFRDPGLKISATRVVFIIWCLVVLAGWIIVSLHIGKLQPIPQSVVAVLGLLAGVKATQRLAEGKSDPDRIEKLLKSRLETDSGHPTIPGESK